jgi:serine/threonine-protein kinase
LQEAFEGALELRSKEREEYLERTLAGFPDLLEEVRDMLMAHEDTPPLAIEKRFVSEEETTLAGSLIGAYRLQALIGRGGMGEVYLAEREDAHFRQQVAIKVLLPGLYGSDAIARFRLERQILAKLNHPIIVPLLDGGMTADGRPYLVLQYAKGQPISEYCEKQRLSTADRLALFCEVARAVEYAHRNLVVHRDLKPSNILVTEEGQVRLLDFGIAKLLDPSPENLEVPTTRVELRIMTLDYAAPEQIRGEAITTVTDVYALGALLYELLTGRRPFTASEASRGELERRILEEEPIPPSQAVNRSEDRGPKSEVESVAEPGELRRLAKRLRGDLDTIVLRALKKEPDRRYPSAEQMARDIERHLAGEPVLAQRSSFGYRFGKLVRRNPMASALTALSFLLLLILAGTATHQSRRIARERDVARGEQQKAESVIGVLVDLFATSNPREVPGGGDLTVGEFLKRIEGKVIENPGLDPQVHARLKHVLGVAYFERSQYDRARALMEDSLAQFRSTKGDDDPAAAAVFHDLARLAAVTDSPGKAVPMMRESLERHRRLFGERHEKYAACLQDLAETLPLTDEKKRLLEEALAIRRALPGAPNKELAASLNALGAYYIHADQPVPAERYLNEALSVMNLLFPRGHTDTLSVVGNLATVQARLGNLDKAAELRANSIELTSKLLGPESLELAITFNNLGNLLMEKGNRAEAEIAMRRALALFVKLLGAEHAHVCNTTRNLAVILYFEGRNSEALAHMRQAFDLQSRLGGEEQHRSFMEGQLAILLLRNGQRQEGLNRLRTVVQRLKSIKPTGQHYLASAQIWLGYVLLESGAAEEAEQLFREGLEFRRTSFPAGHGAIAEAECGLGVSLAGRGKSKEAEALIQKNLPIFSSWSFADPAELKLTRQRLDALRKLSAKG